MAKVDQLFRKALARHQRGDVDGARQGYRRALRSQPGHLDANYMLGTLEAEAGNLVDAARLLERAAEVNPSSHMVQNNLGIVRQKQGALTAAVGHYERALALNPDLPQAHINLGHLRLRLGAPDAARRHFDAVLRQRPNDREARVGLATLQMRTGADGQARATLLPMLSQWPDDPVVVGAFARLAAHGSASGGERQVAIGRLGRLLDVAPKALSASDRGPLAFALGRLLDLTGDAPGALRRFQEGNQLSAVPFDRAAFAARLRALRDRAERISELPSRSSGGSGRVFIAGLPRSGGTLIEQILGAHSRVRTTGESGLLERLLADESGAYAGDPVGLSGALDGVAGLTAVATAYDGALAGADFVTDKSIENVELLGAIAQLFPDAVVVRVRRDLADTALSCFFHDFAGRYDYVHDLGDAGFAAACIDRLWDDLAATLPVRVVEVDYAGLVAAPEPHIRALIAGCGLPWDDACLRPEDSRRFVSTASYEQVRRPIFTSSVGRAERYAGHVDALHDGLAAGARALD